MSREILQSDFIPVDLDNLLDTKGDSLLKYDEKTFQDGLSVGSFYAGFATALFNAGLDEESVAKLLETWVIEFGSR